MKSTLIAIAATCALALPGAALANNTVAHLKGHTAVAAPAKPSTNKAKPRAVCHPDPSKGRACRHHNAQAEAKTAAPALARAEAPRIR